MNFINALDEQLNKTFTENGDSAFVSTGSRCLDYFSLVGAKRFDSFGLMKLFLNAYVEDKLKAIKILFFSRDIRNGLGERNSFRLCFNTLCNFYPDVAKQVLKYIPEYGRYDDIFAGFNTPIENDVIELIKTQLEKDMDAKTKGQSISLLSKWLPSINTSSSETRMLAKKISSSLNLSYKDYRQMLSFLRKDIIIENNLRTLDYSFDYSFVPSCAFIKYQKAFIQHDSERYNEFLEDVHNGKKSIKTNALYPYQVIRSINKSDVNNPDIVKGLNETWKSFSHTPLKKKSIVVRDGSYSMTWGDKSITPMEIATSLAILFAERLTGPFKNKFITFSESPELITIPEDMNIVQKYNYVTMQDECANTDIAKVYQLILDTYKSGKVDKEDQIEQIVIISDMEFDSCVEGKTTFQSFKEEFEKLDYAFPNVVFWNVNARDNHLPVTMNEKNVTLLSGASDKLIDLLMNDTIDPMDFMNQTLSHYSIFDTIQF